jgi:hypothetical protein
VVDGRDQRQPEAADAEQAVAEPLVIVDDVEFAGTRAQRPQRPDAERQRLGERPAPHHRDLERVRPVPDLRRAGRPERVVVPVEVQARQPPQQRAVVELRVGLTGEHLDVVPERGEFPAQVAHIDALAARVRLAAVREQRNAQPAIH